MADTERTQDSKHAKYTVSIVETLDEANDVVKRHEESSKEKYVVYVQSKDFGNSSMILLYYFYFVLKIDLRYARTCDTGSMGHWICGTLHVLPGIQEVIQVVPIFSYKFRSVREVTQDLMGRRFDRIL